MSNTPNTTATDTITLPVTVRNINEARELCHDYKSVLTAGPTRHEVQDFMHPDHLVVEFADSITEMGPTFEAVATMMEWGATRDNILVHCHAGISRSTATAWGIAIAHGYDPKEALNALKAAHPREHHYAVPSYIGNGYPYERIFSPNARLVTYLEQYFGYDMGTLLVMTGRHRDLNKGLWKKGA